MLREYFEKLIKFNWLQVGLLAIVAPGILAGLGYFLEKFPSDKLFYILSGGSLVLVVVLAIVKLWYHGFSNAAK